MASHSFYLKLLYDFCQNGQEPVVSKDIDDDKPWLKKDDPLLDFLSRLEHKRWCNSYYSMNFKYSHIKDENAKTHPCLIDDWEIVIGEKFDICHPEYDLLSIFTLFQMED